MAKAQHHKGRHHQLSAQVRMLAYANPDTQCMAEHCKGWGNRTLSEHPPTSTGKPPRWHAGHVIPGRRATTLADYRPEVDVCNIADGHDVRQGHRVEPSRTW